MVNETPTNVVKADLLSVQRRIAQRKNSELMQSTIVEDEFEGPASAGTRLRENSQIKALEDAVLETHKRVSIMQKFIGSTGNLPTSISEHVMSANKLINQSYRDWEKNAEWLQAITVALCNAKFPELAVDLIDQLFRRGLVFDQATEQFARHLFGTLMNFTENSDQFRECLAKAKLIEILSEYLKDKTTIEEASKYQKLEDFLRYALAIFHNLARDPDLKADFLAHDATLILSAYLDYPNDYVQCVSLLCITQVLSDTPEANAWASKKAFEDTLIEYCHVALLSSDRRCRGVRVEELGEGLCLLAVAKEFKEKLVQNKKLTSVVKGLLTSLDATYLEQHRGVELAWQLSFVESGKTKIENECMESLQNLANSDSLLNSDLAAIVKRNAAKTIAYIKNWAKWHPKPEPSVITERQVSLNSTTELLSTNKSSNSRSSAGTKRSKPVGNSNKPGHVFFSYCHRQGDLVGRIYQRMKDKKLFDIWIDFSNISNDWINSMAKGIENASVVVIFYSEAYKQSSNCKAEAEYAFTLRKPIVPVKVQAGYKADGWLGIIVSRVLWIEMSLPIDDSAFDKLVSEIKNNQQRPNSATSASKPDSNSKCCSLL